MTEACWEWTAAKSHGRGVIRIRDQINYVSRVSWLIHFGAIPAGNIICHHCDNGICVRPDHLFIGLPKNNSEDMVEKNRGIRGRKKPDTRQWQGSAHGGSKLTEATVEQIRNLYAAGSLKGGELAEMFGIRPATVSGIVRGRHWRHARGPVSSKRCQNGSTEAWRGDNHGMSKLKNSDIPKIRLMLNDGAKQKDVAVLFGVSL